MPEPIVVVAGTSFSAIREYLTAVLPRIRLETVDPVVLRNQGCAAEVLIPAMTRISSEMMDRIAGLRLIQQWGTGLDGVEVRAATQKGYCGRQRAERRKW